MNGVRIAGIIALAHWGGQRLNIVDDHLLYGWGFFAIVLLGAGYTASFFADGEPSAPNKTQASQSHNKLAAKSVDYAHFRRANSASDRCNVCRSQERCVRPRLAIISEANTTLNRYSANPIPAQCHHSLR